MDAMINASMTCMTLNRLQKSDVQTLKSYEKTLIVCFSSDGLCRTSDVENELLKQGGPMILNYR